MSDAYVEYGFFPAKYLKNYIPQNSSKEKPFIVNFFGKEDVECYSDQPSRIKLKKGKEIFKKYKVDTNSIIQFDVSKLNEGLKIINIK